MKELTPMQEAIEIIVKQKKDVIILKEYAKGYDIAMNYCINILTELLPKEQQIIEDAKKWNEIKMNN